MYQQYPGQQAPPAHNTYNAYPPSYAQQAPPLYPPQHYQALPPAYASHVQQVVPSQPYSAPIPGARGDGITDDTAAVQRAITSAPVGGVLSIPMGNYSIRAHIKIDKPITITGPGTIQCDMKVKDWTHMIMVRTDNCTFDGVQFYNKSGNEGVGVISVEGSNFKISNCVMDNFYEGIMLGKMVTHGVPHTYHSYITITNNKMLNIHGVTGGSICHGDGIAFFGCTDVTISNNLLTAAPGKSPRNGINSGPEGYIRSTRVTISENQVLGDWDYPLTTEWGTYCHLINNQVDGNCIAGIIERGENIVVSGNRINVRPGKRDGNVSGIHFYGVANGTINNNIITGAAKYGIMCNPSHETKLGVNLYVADNNVDGDFQYCVFFGDTDQTKLHHNVLRTTNKENSCMGVHGWQNKNMSCTENDIQAVNGTAFILVGTKGGGILYSCTRRMFDKHPECRDIQGC